MGLRADSARPQRVSGSARTDSRRAESARNPIASHVNFGDDSALSAFTRTQWAFSQRSNLILMWDSPFNNEIQKAGRFSCLPPQPGGGELGVLRVHEHPLSTQAHPLVAKSTPSK